MSGNRVDGYLICSLLEALSGAEAEWHLRDIETLAGGRDAPLLGSLWRQVTESQSGVIISMSDLRAALISAFQVISLDARLVKDDAIEIWVEDGILRSPVINREADDA